MPMPTLHRLKTGMQFRPYFFITAHLTSLKNWDAISPLLFYYFFADRTIVWLTHSVYQLDMVNQFTHQLEYCRFQLSH